MHPILSSTAPDSEAFRAFWTRPPALQHDHGLIYLVVAGLCLIVALRFLRRALAPVGLLVQVAAAVAIVGLAVGAALALLTAAAFSAR
jgi:hypothetical protein